VTETTALDQVAELRKRAEEILRKKAGQKPEDPGALSPEEAGQLLHELQVHQIELEMQNEEMRQAQAELEASRARYFDLYDLAPVGYFTLSEQGLILEANLTAVKLLGEERSQFVGQPLTRFILPEDQDVYYRRRKQLLKTGAPQVCELRMLCAGAAPFWARIDATAAQDEDGSPTCRAVMSDVTERKRAEEALRQSERRYKALASESTAAEERLRREVASEIHDEIGQTLAMAKARIEALREGASDESLQAALTSVVGSLEQTFRGMRDLTARVSYPALNVLGFPKVVEKWLYDEVQVRHCIETVFENDVQDKPLDDDMRAVLFRSVRELLVNVVKHAHATRVIVSMTRVQDQIAVVVEDNGVGFDPEEVMTRSQGFGLLSIRESLERLNGSLDIKSHRHAGSKITLLGPLKVGGHLEAGSHEDLDR
jgi:PAS domain S-box-containing protein